MCSNVGVATVVRVHPELADHEHLYFERLHGGDEDFNAAYDEAYKLYFSMLAKPEPAKTDPPPRRPHPGSPTGWVRGGTVKGYNS